MDPGPGSWPDLLWGGWWTLLLSPCSTCTSQMLQDCAVVSESTVCVQVTLDSQLFPSHDTVLLLLSDLRWKHLSYIYREFPAFQPHLLSFPSAHPRVFSTLLLSGSGRKQLDLLSAFPGWTNGDLSLPTIPVGSAGPAPIYQCLSHTRKSQTGPVVSEVTSEGPGKGELTPPLASWLRSF